MAELKTIPGLSAKLAVTRARLARLAFMRAFWPLLLFVAVFIGFALLDGFGRLSGPLAAGLTLACLLTSGALALRGWTRWRRPHPGVAESALDAQSSLRPLHGLTDRPARPEKASETLWRAHGRRLAEAAQILQPPRFTGEWKALDPAYLRFAVPVVLVALFFAAGNQAGERLRMALVPDLGALAGAEQLRVEAWITPPRHTGRPPVFLDDSLDSVRVPAGSTVTLRAFNRAAPHLVLSGDSGRARTRFEATPDGAFEARAEITEDTRVAVHFWGERAAWQVLASPDDPPTARFVGLPSITTNDQMQFDWEISDDYGVERLQLAIRLRDPHPAAPDAEDRLPVPMGPVMPKQASEQATLATERHRWAGLPVQVQLVAVDGAGQEGRSESYPFILPEKLFLQPLARSAQEIRVTVLREPRGYREAGANQDALMQGAVNTAATRRLEHAPEDVRRAALMLDALTIEPARYFEDEGVYFGLEMAHSILRSAPDKTEADSVDSLLWSVALKAEYGSAADALRALLAARRALEQALRDGASEDQIRRLMEAFREAAENYVAAKMAEAIMSGQEAPNMSDMGEGGGMGLGQSDLEEMMNALEDLAETGASDQARQLLSDITNLLENLEFQMGGQGGEGGFAMPGGQPGEDGEEGEQPEGERELSEAIERLSDLLREQRELNDDTLAEQRGEGQPFGEENGEEGTGGPGGLAERQRDLSGEADRFAEGEPSEDAPGEGATGDGEAQEEGPRGFGALSEEDRRRLGEIARAQEEAARELERGNSRRAGRLQDEATRGLRDLSNELAEELSALEAARRGETNEGEELDPFGRPVGGADGGRNVTIPDEAERQRARDILEELRRRYEDATSEEERRYLERLLDRF